MCSWTTPINDTSTASRLATGLAPRWFFKVSCAVQGSINVFRTPIEKYYDTADTLVLVLSLLIYSSSEQVTSCRAMRYQKLAAATLRTNSHTYKRFDRDRKTENEGCLAARQPILNSSRQGRLSPLTVMEQIPPFPFLVPLPSFPVLRFPYLLPFPLNAARGYVSSSRVWCALCPSVSTFRQWYVTYFLF